MSMRSAQSPRKLYPRSVKNGGPYVLMVKGDYFAPRKGEKTAFDPEVEVTHVFLKPSGGKQRIEVTQVAAGKADIKETWVERDITFKKRKPKAPALLDAAQPDILIAPADGSGIPVMEG